jgi:hypothetical protein
MVPRAGERPMYSGPVDAIKNEVNRLRKEPYGVATTHAVNEADAARSRPATTPRDERLPQINCRPAGVGKSTVGRHLARHLKRQFVDSTASSSRTGLLNREFFEREASSAATSSNA